MSIFNMPYQEHFGCECIYTFVAYMTVFFQIYMVKSTIHIISKPHTRAGPLPFFSSLCHVLYTQQSELCRYGLCQYSYPQGRKGPPGGRRPPTLCRSQKQVPVPSSSHTLLRKFQHCSNVLWFSLIWLCSSILLLHCFPQRLHFNLSLFSCTCFPCLCVHVATVIQGNYGISLWMVCFSMLCHIIVVSELLPTSVAFCSVRVYNFFTIEAVSSYFFQLCFEVLNYIFQFPYYLFPVLIAFHLFGFYSLGRTFILTFLTRGRF